MVLKVSDYIADAMCMQNRKQKQSPLLNILLRITVTTISCISATISSKHSFNCARYLIFLAVNSIESVAYTYRVVNSSTTWHCVLLSQHHAQVSLALLIRPQM